MLRIGGMSAETVGRHMPSVVTLDDLAAMIAADEHGHRYEVSPEGAIPDLTLWSKPQPRSVWLPIGDLVLGIEIVSPGSEAMDEMIKRQEYATAGIPRYWMVDRDVAQTVTLHRLERSSEYTVTTKVPLSWLLNTSPAEHLG